MNNAGRTNMAADHGTGGGSSGGNSMPKWLKISGIGCAILLLVGGALLGLAVFKGATCCSEFGDLTKVIETIQGESHGAASALHRGDYQAFYDQLDESTRETVSVDDIEADFEEYRSYLDASPPFPMRVNVDEGDVDLTNLSDMERFRVSTYYADPQFEERLRVNFVVRAQRPDEEEGEAEVRIVEWETSVEEQHFAETPYAGTAERFQDRIERGDYENAYRMVAPQSELAAQNQEQFVSAVESRAERIGEMRRTKIQGIYPGESVRTVVVRMLLIEEGDEPYFVDYVVNWQNQIVDVSEIQPAGVPLEEVDPDAGENGDDEQQPEETEARQEDDAGDGGTDESDETESGESADDAQ